MRVVFLSDTQDGSFSIGPHASRNDCFLHKGAHRNIEAPTYNLHNQSIRRGVRLNCWPRRRCSWCFAIVCAFWLRNKFLTLILYAVFPNTGRFSLMSSRLLTVILTIRSCDVTNYRLECGDLRVLGLPFNLDEPLGTWLILPMAVTKEFIHLKSHGNITTNHIKLNANPTNVCIGACRGVIGPRFEIILL